MAFKLIKHDPANTIKYDQTRSNGTKQGDQTAKSLFTKQCLLVFRRQTFLVCPGRKTIYLVARLALSAWQWMKERRIIYIWC